MRSRFGWDERSSAVGPSTPMAPPRPSITTKRIRVSVRRAMRGSSVGLTSWNMAGPPYGTGRSGGTAVRRAAAAAVARSLRDRGWRTGTGRPAALGLQPPRPRTDRGLSHDAPHAGQAAGPRGALDGPGGPPPADRGVGAPRRGLDVPPAGAAAR